MTFSIASVSAFEVDEVAATAAGATCLRSGRAGAARGRDGKTGAIAGAGVGPGPVSLAIGVSTGAAAVATAVILPGVLLLTVILLAVELGTKLRAIGRGFGRGTLGLAAQAFVASADNPTASVRLVAKAVDRNAAARTRRFTAFLRCESFNRLSFRSI